MNSNLLAAGLVLGGVVGIEVVKAAVFASGVVAAVPGIVASGCK